MGVMPQIYFVYTIHMNVVKKVNKNMELKSVEYRDAIKSKETRQG